MSRVVRTFSARLLQVRRLPINLRIAALGEALLASSPLESDSLAPELLELAILPAFAAEGEAVRSRPLLSFRRLLAARAMRHADAALSEISRCWGQLTACSVEAALGVGQGRWHIVVPKVATDPSRSVRLSLAKLVGDAGDTRLAELAVAMLHDQDAAVSQRAEQSLLLLALGCLRDTLAADEAAASLLRRTPSPLLGRGFTTGVQGPREELHIQAVDGAMTFAEHRRRGPILAILMLADRTALRGRRASEVVDPRSLAAFVGNAEHPGHSSLRSVLRWSKLPIARIRALEWLSRDHLASACVERLARPATAIEHELTLSQSHLLARPARSARAGSMRAPAPRKAAPPAAANPARNHAPALEGPFPPASTLRRLSEDARRGLPLMVSSTRRPAGTRWAALIPLLSDPSPVVRHAALRAVPLGALPDFCFDHDPRVAQTAMLRWSTSAARSHSGAPLPTSPDQLRVLRLLCRSPHPASRVWAVQDVRTCLDSDATSLSSRLRIRRLLAANRSAALDWLRESLRGPHALRQLMLLRALGIVADFEGDLLALASPHSDADNRLLATVASALGELNSPATRSAAMALLSHPDPRVRANAIESAARHSHLFPRAPGHLPANILELKADLHHRVRANATRAELIRELTDASPDPLTSMLTDPRPMHRLAGVWLASRTLPARARYSPRWAEPLARISEMARFDDDSRVRLRAAACSQRLEAQLRSTWRAAGPVGAANAS